METKKRKVTRSFFLHKMRTRAIIQARMSSRRLRGKSLMPIAGKPSLYRVIERVKAMDFVDEIVVATSDQSDDDPIAAYAESLGVGVYRGDQKDVLLRFKNAVADLEAEDCLMRITADNLLYDPIRSKRVFQEFRNDDWDYVHIDGLSHVAPEFLKVRAIREAEESTHDPADREHVTPYLRKNQTKFKIKTLPPDFAGLRPQFDKYLTLDTQDDFDRLEKLYKELEGESNFFSLDDCYHWLEKKYGVLIVHPPQPGEKRVRLAGREIGDGCPTFIVAEIGQNHNGDMDMAKKLIRMAARCGVDAVKFQKRDIKYELTDEAYNKIYDNPNSFGHTYGEHREFLELSDDQHRELREYTLSHDLTYICTACDQPSVESMERIGNPIYKIASRDATNTPLLKIIAQTGKPVILSTGMVGMKEIHEAIETLGNSAKSVMLMQCISQYPADIYRVNLKAIKTLRNEFNLLTGFSDHTIGIAASIAAVVMGACIIEKHITLSRALKGTDHAVSIEEKDLKQMVEYIRQVELSIGNGEKKIDPAVIAARNKLARSLTNSVQIPAGTILAEDMLVLKSPGHGLMWNEKEIIVGKKAAKDIPIHSTLKVSDFE